MVNAVGTVSWFAGLETAFGFTRMETAFGCTGLVTAFGPDIISRISSSSETSKPVMNSCDVVANVDASGAGLATNANDVDAEPDDEVEASVNAATATPRRESF